jgi:hypothetical protein
MFLFRSVLDASMKMLDSLNSTIHSNAAKTLANLIDVPPAPHAVEKDDDTNIVQEQKDASLLPSSHKGHHALVQTHFVAEQLLSLSVGGGASQRQRRLLQLLWSDQPSVVHASLKMIMSMVRLPSSISSKYLDRHDGLLASLCDASQGIAAIANAKSMPISAADLGCLCIPQCKLLRSLESHARSAIDNDALSLVLDYLLFLLSVFGGSALDGKPVMNDTFVQKQQVCVCVCVCACACVSSEKDSFLRSGQFI